LCSATLPPPSSPPFPYTTLFRSNLDLATLARLGLLDQVEDIRREDVAADDRQIGRRLFRLGLLHHAAHPVDVIPQRLAGDHIYRDRKSTRLNSSHVKISYAVFCL